MGYLVFFLPPQVALSFRIIWLILMNQGIIIQPRPAAIREQRKEDVLIDGLNLNIGPDNKIN